MKQGNRKNNVKWAKNDSEFWELVGSGELIEVIVGCENVKVELASVDSIAFSDDDSRLKVGDLCSFRNLNRNKLVHKYSELAERERV